ncbi:MAG TPA: TIM barrel protein, partial [Verrucomicrobiota bacterium]|nr:TIM barrel protein [Verrucomicrobiota bacterium]
MPRPITLFTGQWADLPLARLLPLVKKMGYDGVELACWGDHFEVDRALAEKDYVQNKWTLLKKNGLNCFAISSHLVGQAVCDLIDERHKAILPPDVWGDGKPEGVRQRAAEKMKDTARAARKFFNAKPGRKGGDDFPAVVNGFTGSSIWHSIYAFPPTGQDFWNKGFEDFARR